jgi:Kef-type K+ transport system membrane component KefB
MPALSFSGLVLVAGLAFLAPLLTELTRARWLPAVVIEIVAGILLGPSVLNWVRVDIPLQVLSLLGLAFLLFLSGLEVEFAQLRGSLLTVIGVSFLASFLLALAIGFGLQAIGLIRSPLLVAIILVATSLGIVIPLLKDGGESTSRFGQLVIGAASLADCGTIILLSLFFSRTATGLGTQVVLLAIFAALAAVAALAVFRAERSTRLAVALRRLQDTTAQIRIRGAFLLLAALVALTEALGLEVILGAFAAGVILRFLDQDQVLTHPQFRQKLEGVGFGVFIPVFFVTSGVQFDLHALLASSAALSVAGRHAPCRGGGLAAGHLPPLHCRGGPVRLCAWSAHEDDGRGAGGGGAAVGVDLSHQRRHALARWPNRSGAVGRLELLRE